jgi:hypothetical protein
MRPSERGIEGFLELKAAAGDTGRIAGLAGLPTSLIARLEFGSRIPGLPGFEFSVFAHSKGLPNP